ncbi:MAG: hypothetical protein K8R39_09630 [Arcobacteraceae bacterium]|nr:hypothetical protein [Arcobacteraceae bacterium]
MNRLFKKVLVLLVVSTLYLSAETMFLLTKVPKMYLIVENYSEKVSMDVKEEILNDMKKMTDELKIDTSGYSHRALGFLIYDTSIDDMMILNVDLILGEEVKRIDDNEEVYALTYEKRKQFSVNNKTEEEIHEELLDHVYSLLSEFSEQYNGDNI